MKEADLCATTTGPNQWSVSKHPIQQLRANLNEGLVSGCQLGVLLSDILDHLLLPGTAAACGCPVTLEQLLTTRVVVVANVVVVTWFRCLLLPTKKIRFLVPFWQH